MKKARLSPELLNLSPQLLNLDKYAIAKKWIEDFANDPAGLNTGNPSSLFNIQNTKLQTSLYEYLSEEVPKLLKEVTITGVLKFVVDEEQFENVIGKPLEYFICGQDQIDGFAELKAQSKPAKYCGKLFNVGDPTYTCK